MSSSLFILVLIALAFESCKHKSSGQLSTLPRISDTLQPAVAPLPHKNSTSSDTLPLPTSIKVFDVDYYPVTDDILKKYSTVTINGQQYTADYVWFSNKLKNQTLVFELYTDFHHLWTYNFFDDQTSSWALKKMEVNVPEKQPLNVDSLISNANHIDDKYFVTNKGFKLGDKKQKAFNHYGNSDKTFKQDNLDVYYWEFMGDNTYVNKTFHKEKINLKGKPVARNSHGHEVFILAAKDRIVGILFHNFIP